MTGLPPVRWHWPAVRSVVGPKELQEDRNPIVGGLALVDGKMIGERSGSNPDPIAAGEIGRLGQLNETVTLAGPDLCDDVIGHARGADAIHDEGEDTGTPLRGIPLRDDEDETVPREKRRLGRDPPAADGPTLAQSWANPAKPKKTRAWA
jgi:hypothetical protein